MVRVRGASQLSSRRADRSLLACLATIAQATLPGAIHTVSARARNVDGCQSTETRSGVTGMATGKTGMGIEKAMWMSPHKMNGDGHLYMQTDEQRNCVIHYHRAADGTLTEEELIRTGGSGSGEFKPISGQ